MIAIATRLCRLGSCRDLSRPTQTRVAALALVAAAACGVALGADESPVANAIRDHLESEAWPALTAGGDRLHAPETLAESYGERDFEPAWWAAPALERLVDALAEAESHGLRRSDYHYDALRVGVDTTRGRPPSAEEAAELDLLASDAFVIYALHLGHGNVREERIAGWHIDRPDPDLPRRLRDAVSIGPGAAFAEVAPRHPGYERLREALAALRETRAEGGWPTVPSGPSLREGVEDPRVVALRERLDETGAGPARARRSPDAGQFGPYLAAAVRRFQAQHGLEVDGIVGSRTLAALNVPLAGRIRHIAINLERWRWLPPDLGGRYVLVNVAGFSVGLYDDDRLTLGMRAVVGRPYRRTPIFSDRIRYLVFNPYWNIPARIARLEILPKGRAYMASNDIEQVGSRLRQRPGQGNALGRVKFMFPNRFNVYLHDTPARHCSRSPHAASAMAASGWSSRWIWPAPFSRRRVGRLRTWMRLWRPARRVGSRSTSQCPCTFSTGRPGSTGRAPCTSETTYTGATTRSAVRSRCHRRAEAGVSSRRQPPRQ